MLTKREILVIVLVCICALYGLGGVTTIDPGEVGIKIKQLGSNRGMQKDTMDTGTRWVDPFIYDVVIHDTRFKQYTKGLTNMPSSTKDGQPITVDVSLQIGLIDEKVPYLHEKVGKDWYEQIVYPALRAAVRNNTTSQDSDKIYTAVGRASVQDKIEKILNETGNVYGIAIEVNLRDVNFTNKNFIKALERKAQEAQNVVIQERQAKAAEFTAEKMANMAEGEKQKRIKAAEANREELRLEGQGQRLKLEELAKGNLAIARAKAEGTRLQVLAYGKGSTYASVKWAESLGPKLSVWGVPTGAAGTSTIMDLNGMLNGAFKAAQ